MFDAPAAGQGNSARFRVEYVRVSDREEVQARLDGQPVDLESVPLRADGREHLLQITLG